MLVVVYIRRGDRRSCASVAVVGGSPAEYAVVLGEHVAELCHPSTYAGRLLDQIYFQACVRHVQRSAHTAYTAADH